MPTATIVVTDLLATALGARAWEKTAPTSLHRLRNRLLRHAVEAHGGVVVKGQ